MLYPLLLVGTVVGLAVLGWLAWRSYGRFQSDPALRDAWMAQAEQHEDAPARRGDPIPPPPPRQNAMAARQAALDEARRQSPDTWGVTTILDRQRQKPKE